MGAVTPLAEGGGRLQVVVTRGGAACISVAFSSNSFGSFPRFLGRLRTAGTGRAI
jgi:hypothetical protein